MSIVGRPPVFGIGHEPVQILLDGVEIQGVEFPGVVESLGAETGDGSRVGPVVVLRQYLQVEPLGPPICVRRAAAQMEERALRFVARHNASCTDCLKLTMIQSSLTIRSTED